MKDPVSSGNTPAQILFPYQPDHFWELLRQVVREELEKQKPNVSTMETPGLTYKPLYKIAEVCALFHVSKPTIYDWVKHGKLKPFKVRSRVYFLWQDLQQLIPPAK